jgi:SAM-dependent methyltransferase
MTQQPANFKAYDICSCITEIYDQVETQRDDVNLLLELIGGKKYLRILEPFCGNGRILIPLAQDGHELVGMDKSRPMLESLRKKIQNTPGTVQNRISLKHADVLSEAWPKDFDLVILGSNCLYELATPDQQEKCIRNAHDSLKFNGYLYLDNNHMEGDLDLSWRKSGIKAPAFPTGKCSNGTLVKGSMETIWYNINRRLVRFRRTVEITTPDGETTQKEWVEQKHPPSTVEMKAWLKKYCFSILNLWGGRDRSLYTNESERAVFWAKPT